MKITKRQLKRIILEAMIQGPDLGRGKDFATGGSGEGRAEAMAAADEAYYKQEQAKAPSSAKEWMEWGISHDLDANLDRSGQVVFYTADRIIASDAYDVGADVQEDNMGQFVIYTGASEKGRTR